ncbi:MAG: CdaR family protein [Eubacteriales bacterium]|nr:CdaR family protein [Eubacteriales bacterium]
MKQWLKKYNILTWIISLILAIGLWCYTMNQENPTRTLEYRNISVQLLGADDLYNTYNLSVIEGTEATVDVRVSAPSSRLANLTASQIKVTANLNESISTSGTYDLAYQVILPESGMTCVDSNPSTISVTVDRIETKSVPVEVVIEGDSPDGYKIGEPELQVDAVSITGPENELDNVAKAEVSLNAKDLNKSISDVSSEYTLVDKNGASIDMTNISRETTRVKISVPVLRVKEVPLSVALTPETSVEAKNASIALSPSTVEVQGDPDAVDAMESIEVGSVNINKAENGDVFTFAINPPTGITLTNGQEKNVRAVLSMDSTEQRVFTVTNISVSDTATNPTKKVELQTASMEVKLVGTKKILDQVNNDSIAVVAEINSSELTPGKHKVGVTVDTPDDVSVNGSYSVEVVIRD